MGQSYGGFGEMSDQQQLDNIEDKLNKVHKRLKEMEELFYLKLVGDDKRLRRMENILIAIAIGIAIIFSYEYAWWR